LRSELAKELPPGIEVEFDEQFDAMFSYKAKTTAPYSRPVTSYQRRRVEVARPGKIQARLLEEMIKLSWKESRTRFRVARRLRKENPRS